MIRDLFGGRCEACHWGKHGRCEGEARGCLACWCHADPPPQEVLLTIVKGSLDLLDDPDPARRRVGRELTDYWLDRIGEDDS